MEELARLGAGGYHNAARNLHQWVHKTGKTLPVQVSACEVPVKTSASPVSWPVLTLESWLRFLLQTAGAELVLGGCGVQECDDYEAMFLRFWERYRSFEPNHAVYIGDTAKSTAELRRTIPFCVHGDEGRGLCKVPVQIESFQPVIPFLGEDELNMLGHPGYANTVV